MSTGRGEEVDIESLITSNYNYWRKYISSFFIKLTINSDWRLRKLELCPLELSSSQTLCLSISDFTAHSKNKTQTRSVCIHNKKIN